MVTCATVDLPIASSPKATAMEAAEAPELVSEPSLVRLRVSFKGRFTQVG